MFVKAGYAASAIGALLLVAIVSIFLGAFIPTWVAVIVGLLLLLIPAFYHFKQKLVRYTLTDSKLEMDSGFISRTTRNVPIRRIQDVTVSATAMQRLLGFGDLVIDNASEEGGKAVLKNINTPKQYADILLKEMRKADK
jgi:putative membrane protein